jgi:hypothetical protein
MGGGIKGGSPDTIAHEELEVYEKALQITAFDLAHRMAVEVEGPVQVVHHDVYDGRHLLTIQQPGFSK